jgi:hypothetical protein
MKTFILLVRGLNFVTLVYVVIKLMIGADVTDLAAGLGLVVEGSAVAFLLNRRKTAAKSAAAAAEHSFAKMEERYRKLLEKRRARGRRSVACSRNARARQLLRECTKSFQTIQPLIGAVIVISTSDPA